MSVVFVCANGSVRAFEDVPSAIDAARELASRHACVGVDLDEAGAIRVAHRALPGMVLVSRAEAFAALECYPLTRTTALVRPCRGTSSRSPVARTLRSMMPRATPLAPTTS
jgi:hypothetical protein